MTPPTSGQRKNGPVPLHQLQQLHPAVSQSIPSITPAYPRKPPPTDFVASNLQQILASLTAEEPHRPEIHPSMLYRPVQGYVAPPPQDKPKMPYRPAAYTNVKPLTSSSQHVPQIWSANMWANHPPGMVTPFAAQASIRHETPARMQPVNTNRPPNAATPFVAQASIRHETPARMQPVNTNRPPNVAIPFVAQASIRHETPARMQPVNINRPPNVATPFSAQASFRHDTPASMQQVNINRPPNVATPFSAQASFRHETPVRIQPVNTNTLPNVATPFSAQASFRHETPASVQQIKTNRPPIDAATFSAEALEKVSASRPPVGVTQVNTVQGQRVPFRQNVAGQLQRLNALSSQGGPSRQYQNQGTKVLQQKGSSAILNYAEQFHTPIIWHIPLGNTRKALPGRFQKPFYTASPIAPTGQRILGQMNAVQGALVRNRTAGSIQNPYVVPIRQPFLSQKPLVQKQRIGFMPPLRIQNNINPQSGGPKSQVATSLQRQQQQQQSLAYKMALLDQPNHAPQSNVPGPSPWQKQMPSTQQATSTQKQLPPSRPYYANYYPKPPYSPNVQHRLLIPLARMQTTSKGPLAPASQKPPQGIPQRQTAPFSPHLIYGQNSWPWGAWKHQASPIVQASSRSSSFPRPQAYGNNLPSYHPSAGLIPNLPASPYTVSPQVLLYSYHYPKTIINPLTRITTNLKGDNMKGSFLQKLTQQISSAAFNSKPGEATTSSNPTVTGQTKGTVTIAQSNKGPYGSKQLAQIPYAPYYRLLTGSTRTPQSQGVLVGPLIKPFQGRQQDQTGQLTSPPLVTSQTAWKFPNVAYPNAKVITQPQRTVYKQLPSVADRKSQLTKGLLNRPIYIETVPFQLYYQLQNLPSLNTQSGTQRYLSSVLNDILRLRYGKRKKKKKKRGVKEKSRLYKMKDSKIVGVRRP